MKNIINIFVNQPQPQVAPDQDRFGWLAMYIM